MDSNSNDKAENRRSATHSAADFALLNPDYVLDALFRAGFRCDGRLLALNSYENRVYQLGMEEGAHIVAKFYRPQRWTDAQILEEHAFLLALQAAEIPVVSPLLDQSGRSLFHTPDFRFAVFQSQGGRAPELDRPEVLESLGRYLGRIHAVGVRHVFHARWRLDHSTWGAQSLRRLLAEDGVPLDVRTEFETLAKQLLAGIGACFERAGDLPQICLHGDCHWGNVLWHEVGESATPYFLDFDDSCTGPAIQDMWMLLSGSRSEMQAQMGDLLASYESFAEFDGRSMHLLEALRSLRLLHYAAWLLHRWNDPAFRLAFPWFHTALYWQEKLSEIREQIDRMESAPILV